LEANNPFPKPDKPDKPTKAGAAKSEAEKKEL
jgi:hypothetical protein